MRDEWIDIKKEKPPKRTDILLTDGKKVTVCWLHFNEREKLYIQFGRTNDIGIPTHWMFLPELPK